MKPKILVFAGSARSAGTAFDDGGEPKDERHRKALEAVVARLVEVTAKLGAG